MNKQYSRNLSWDIIEENIPNISKVDGGFTSAQRGLVRLPAGEHVFVKIGVDESTKTWAKKEIAVYQFLTEQGFPYIPTLLATNSDKTAFALEPLVEGWDWENSWTEERLRKTFEAIDALAIIRPEGDAKKLFGQKTITESADGWSPLAASSDMQNILKNKLRSIGENEIADSLDFARMSEQSASFKFHHNVLVHNDVRADNCAWNAKERIVKLVDWNWAQLGDLRIDTAAVLIHAKKAGFNISNFQGRLDKDALHWIAGFWFRSAAMPVRPGGPEGLRDFQLQSAVVALKLAWAI